MSRSAYRFSGISALLLVAGAGCSDVTGPDDGPIQLRPGGSEGARLLIQGTASSSRIQVTYGPAGVEVEVDDLRETFQEPIRRIEIDTGDGQNTLRYEHLVMTDLELRVTGGGDTDDLRLRFEPASLGSPASAGTHQLSVEIDTREGPDLVDFLWNSTALPGLDADARLIINGMTTDGPETYVTAWFMSGDPDQPIISGMVYNPQGNGADAPADRWEMDFDVGLGPATAVAEMRLVGGTGRDDVEVSADYSAGGLQLGHVLLDLDLKDGDNTFEGEFENGAVDARVESIVRAGDGHNELTITAHELTHVVQHFGTSGTSVHSEVVLGNGDNQLRLDLSGFGGVRNELQIGHGNNAVESRSNHSIVAFGVQDAENHALSFALGDGDNHVLIDDVFRDRGEYRYRIELGEGENETAIVFGDGTHGRTPPNEARVVAAEYRTGGGSNTLEVDVDVLGPLTAEFALDPGAGHNSVVQNYRLTQTAEPGLQFAPSQVKVLTFAAGELDDLDIQIGERASAGASLQDPFNVGVAGAGVRGGVVDFVSAFEPEPATSDPEWVYVPVRRTLVLQDMSVGGRLDVLTDPIETNSLLVYLQDRIEVDAGAVMDVHLRGGGGREATLALLSGLSSAGDFRFLLDGGAGDDLLAALVRDFALTGSVASVEVRGGRGADRLALAVQESDGQRLVDQRIDGGGDASRCFATPRVVRDACEEMPPIDDERLLRLLEEVFGTEYVDIWREGSDSRKE
jgi:hypothetical protein